MRIPRLVLACWLGGAVACGGSVSGDEPYEPEDGTGERDEPLDGGFDAGLDSGPRSGGKRDGATPRDARPAGDGGFTECADTRVEAERKARAVNVVWVVDTSVSMDGEAKQVQNNMNRFAQQVVASGLDDYRLVVLSERSFLNVPKPLGSDTTHFRHVEQSIGSSAALQQLLERFPDYAKFLIPDALTQFVVVTDDDSAVAAQDFVAGMKAKLGNDDFRLNAIASPPGEGTVDFLGYQIGGCTGPYGSAAGAGDAYWEAAMATGGLTFSICSGDWSMLLDELAKAISRSAAVPCSLELPPSPLGLVLDHDQVNVVLGQDALRRVANEAACTGAGWYYDDANEPTGIVLCPASCRAGENGGSLQVSFGCATIVQ
jgi:hypothetical protein